MHNEHGNKMVTIPPKLRVEDRNHYKQSHNGTFEKDQLALHKSSNIAQCSRIHLVEISHKMNE